MKIKGHAKCDLKKSGSKTVTCIVNGASLWKSHTLLGACQQQNLLQSSSLDLQQQAQLKIDVCLISFAVAFDCRLQSSLPAVINLRFVSSALWVPIGPKLFQQLWNDLFQQL